MRRVRNIQIEGEPGTDVVAHHMEGNSTVTFFSPIDLDC